MVAFWFFISFVSETMKSYNYYCLRTRLDTKHSFPIINRIQICREKWENRIGPFLCYIWKCYIMDDDWISQNVFELIIKMHLYLRKNEMMTKHNFFINILHDDKIEANVVVAMMKRTSSIICHIKACGVIRQVRWRPEWERSLRIYFYFQM